MASTKRVYLERLTLKEVEVLLATVTFGEAEMEGWTGTEYEAYSWGAKKQRALDRAVAKIVRYRGQLEAREALKTTHT